MGRLYKIKYKILFILLFFTISSQSQVSEYEYKAAFIERFTRFIEWPNTANRDTFKIVILGDNPFDTSLDEIFKGTKIKNRYVELIYTENIDHLNRANLVFIANSERRRLTEILDILKDHPILIIGDSRGYCKKGVHINMYVDDSYVRYEINQNSIEKSGIKVSSLLFASAKIIETDE